MIPALLSVLLLAVGYWVAWRIDLARAEERKR